MKLKQLAIRLSYSPDFDAPSARLEQYSTPADVAANAVFKAYSLGDIEHMRVLDLGCGTGRLMAAAMLLGAEMVTGIDIDRNALTKAREYLINIRSEFNLILGDVSNSPLKEQYDTVLMNPPFGAQMRGADRPFMDEAMKRADVIYSFHNGPTERFVIKTYNAAGFDAEVLEKYLFTIPHMFTFHQKERTTVECVLIRSKKRRHEE